MADACSREVTMAQLDSIAGLKAGDRISAADLTDLVSGIFADAGLGVFESESAAKLLVDTQLHGIDSHGIEMQDISTLKWLDVRGDPASVPDDETQLSALLLRPEYVQVPTN